MSALVRRVLLWLLVLSLAGIVLLPFTERGSRLLLDNAAALLAIEVEYGGGTLARELAVRRLAWADDDLRLELSDIVLAISPDCLWRSVICFQRLRAGQLEIEVLPGSVGEVAPAPVTEDAGLFAFPVHLQAANLRLDALRVRWDGGEWRQGVIEGAVQISGHTISVERAVVTSAELVLTDTGGPDSPVELPEIDLPLELLVRELLLEQPAWSIYGSAGQLDALRLSGDWSRRALRLQQLQVRSSALGELAASGGIEFSGYWPLSLAAEALVAAPVRWPEQLARALVIEASGDLRALQLQLDIAGPLVLAASGELNTLEPDLPFRAVLSADWLETIALTALLPVPDVLASVALAAPLQLAASGSLGGQDFQLQAAGSAPGYPALELELAGSHQEGRIALDNVRLRDTGGDNTLWGMAELAYGEPLQWSAVLESSGIDLPPAAEFGTGRVQGRLQLLGSLDGDRWDIALADADLAGVVNGLPARLSGFTGIDSQRRLLPSKLEAEVNGAYLLLSSSGDHTAPGYLELKLDELGRWLPDSRGSLSLQASVPVDWREFTLTGALRDIQWNGLEVDSGRVSGSYFSAGAGNFRLEVDLAEVDLAGVELAGLRLEASGTSTNQSLSLRSRGDVAGTLDIAGSAGVDGSWTGQLAATTLQTQEGNWYLEQSVGISYSPAPASLEIAAHCWQYQQTRVCPGATVLAERGSASLAVDGGLEALSAILPETLQLRGAVKGSFAANWAPGEALVLAGELEGRDLLFTRQFGGGESGSLAWDRVDARVDSGPLGLSVAATAYQADSRIVGLDLRLPVDRTGPIAGTLDIAGLQLATLAPFAPTLSVLQGEVRGSLRLLGTVGEPLAEGAIRLSNGRVGLLGNPTELDQLELELEARGNRAALRGSGLLGGGQLRVSGDLLSDPEWRLRLAIAGDNQELLLPPYTRMRVAEQLDVELSDGLLALRGEIVVHEGTLEHEQLPAGSVTLSDDVVEVDLKGNVIYEPTPFDISMNVAVKIADRFQVLGDLVNATVGGDLQLRQEPRNPLQVFGNLNVIGGELRAYQQRLRIQRGTISFAGTADNPELDVRAQREISADKVTVGLHLLGTLKQPQLDIFSDPVMSQGETMSYLIRGRGLDSGAAADGTAMALSLGTGLVNETALVTELNRIPGISNLAFGAEGSTEADTAATVGGYIGERLYLSYGIGIYEPINVLVARLYLQTRLWLEVVSRLENSVDLYYSFDIE